MVKPGTPKYVKTDSKRICQILQNLLLKATHLSQKKVSIEIKCEV